ncbi:MetQ/NlpA family ABC transporter substrate-binding protein [Methylobacterium bullatum]|uniref:Lipoprotein n=1 Tax=Methylobacterium bullatum TaxID=570505 RepID=A0A679KA73_9HYPH|nr:Methionine-binding lipoprotein MetQ [Methylobacterium bullatum]
MPLNRRALLGGTLPLLGGTLPLLGGTLALLTASTARAAAPLRVVASSVPHAEILTYVQDTLAPDLPLRIIEISGDIRPNRLVLDGDADANFFQHVPYLRSEEAELGVRFAVTASVHVEPLGLYSRRVRSFADLPKGATVALSNNVTNFSRGLKLLQENGLIRLRPGGDGTFATAGDIAENPKSFSFVEVAPPHLPRSLDDVALAVINGNYALESGLDPAKDSLGLERAEGNPYANVLVTTQGLAQDARIQTLSSLLQSAEVAGFIRERYRGAVIPVRGA